MSLKEGKKGVHGISLSYMMVAVGLSTSLRLLLFYYFLVYFVPFYLYDLNLCATDLLNQQFHH